MRKNLTLLGLLIVIAAVVYVALYRWDDVKSLWTEKVEGYERAASAQECIDYVKKAQKDGNYDAMARYVDGDSKAQIDKIAKEAEKLQKEIEALRAVMTDHSISSDKARYALLLLHPFPQEVKFKELTTDGDKATVIAYLDAPPAVLQAKATTTDWIVDKRIFNVLTRKISAGGTAIHLKKVGDEWKIEWPKVEDDVVDFFKEKSGNYVNGLEKVKNEAKRDASTKTAGGFEKALKAQLEDAGK